MGFATQGKAPIFGVGAVTFTLIGPDGTTVSGYVMPTVNSANITHNGATNETKNTSGDIDAVTVSGEYIECAFTLIPTGTSSANALTAATVPKANSTVTISGARVIAVGPFSDALNVASSGSLPDTARWIYTTGGSLAISSEGHASLNLTMRRYPAIAGGTAFTS